jgi:hypothetical protein
VLLFSSIFKFIFEKKENPTIGNESLHEISHDNGVRVVNFATSKILVKSTGCGKLASFFHITAQLKKGS